MTVLIAAWEQLHTTRPNLGLERERRYGPLASFTPIRPPRQIYGTYIHRHMSIVHFQLQIGSMKEEECNTNRSAATCIRAGAAKRPVGWLPVLSGPIIPFPSPRSQRLDRHQTDWQSGQLLTSLWKIAQKKIPSKIAWLSFFYSCQRVPDPISARIANAVLGTLALVR
jgi:hypothetical protein